MNSNKFKTNYENLVQETAEKHNVDVELLKKLIAFEKTKVHLEKRRGAKGQIRKIIEDAIEHTGEKQS
jgi:hypothetical protein